jgi:hypothetical protein
MGFTWVILEATHCIDGQSVDPLYSWLVRITCTFLKVLLKVLLAVLLKVLLAVLLNLWIDRITYTFYESFAGSFVKLMARSNNLHFLWKFW